MNVYLDFDGTVVEHDFPKMGRCNFGAFEVIKKLQDAGHIIILNTARVEHSEEALKDALRLINENHWMLIKDRSQRETFRITPIEVYTKRKIHPAPWNIEEIMSSGIMFIDDIATNIPLKPVVMSQYSKWMVDWDELDKIFIEHKIY